MRHRFMPLALGILVLSALPSCCFFGGHHRMDPPIIKANPRCVTVMHRRHHTPSGDWSLDLEYGYDVQGRLAGIHWRYFTFNGLDPATGETAPVSCERFYDVSPAGQLTLVSETIRDARKGAAVKRRFFEPSIEHWMTLEEARREGGFPLTTPLPPPLREP